MIHETPKPWPPKTPRHLPLYQSQSKLSYANQARNTKNRGYKKSLAFFLPPAPGTIPLRLGCTKSSPPATASFPFPFVFDAGDGTLGAPRLGGGDGERDIDDELDFLLPFDFRGGGGLGLRLGFLPARPFAARRAGGGERDESDELEFLLPLLVPPLFLGKGEAARSAAGLGLGLRAAVRPLARARRVVGGERDRDRLRLALRPGRARGGAPRRGGGERERELE